MDFGTVLMKQTMHQVIFVSNSGYVLFPVFTIFFKVYFILFSFCLNKIRFARPDLKLFSGPILEKFYLLWLKQASLQDFNIVVNVDHN